ncbi:HAMP domain-containing protein [Chromobacterium haemolyticum]|nr:HAMP domain-containing protein [Chromobacterium haemolyticum]
MRRDMVNYEAILQRLRRGDPARPLLVPRQADIQQALNQVERQWREQLKPVLLNALTRPGDNAAEAARFAERVALYVEDINTFVSGMEAYNARNTDYLRLLQLLLASMAVVGTVALIYLMLLIVLRPLDKLHQGIRQLAAGDYSVRVPVETDDEFGQVSTGFNLMAACLSESHATLEERVRGKTASLQQKKTRNWPCCTKSRPSAINPSRWKRCARVFWPE